MRIRAILAAVGVAAAALAATPLSAAHAGTGPNGVQLPLHDFYQMAVDSVHHHLFFSQGSSGTATILVTDFSGSTVASIAGHTGATGIVLSPDGSTLYAAVAGAHEVTAISTTTLKQTAAYQLGQANTPFNVAVQSGKLWVSYGTGTAGQAAIGDFDLSEASPAFETQAAMGGWDAAPMIAADPLDKGNVLVAMDQGVNLSKAASYDTSADPVTIRARQPSLINGAGQSCEALRDLTVVPGGAQFIPACAPGSAYYRYSTTDLSSQGSYSAAKGPWSIAIAAGTGLVALGTDILTSNPIYIYRPGEAAPANQINPGVPGQYTMIPRSLGLSADGSELFEITGGYPGLALHVYDDPSVPTKVAPTLKMSVTPTKATYRPAVHITVHLKTTNGDKTVSVYAKPAGSTRAILLKTGPVSSTGTMTLTFPAIHTTTISAVFAGDAKYIAKTVTATVRVMAAVTLKTSGYYASKRVGSYTYRLYHHTKRLTAVVMVAPNKHGACVKFDVGEIVQGFWYDSLTPCATLDTHSAVSVYFTLNHADLGYDYRIRAVYERGSDTTNESAVSRWQYFRVEK